MARSFCFTNRPDTFAHTVSSNFENLLANERRTIQFPQASGACYRFSLYRSFYRSNKEKRPKCVEAPPQFCRSPVGSLSNVNGAPQLCRAPGGLTARLVDSACRLQKNIFKPVPEKVDFSTLSNTWGIFNGEKVERAEKTKFPFGRRFFRANRPRRSSEMAGRFCCVGQGPFHSQGTAHPVRKSREASSLPARRRQGFPPIPALGRRSRGVES